MHSDSQTKGHKTTGGDGGNGGNGDNASTPLLMYVRERVGQVQDLVDSSPAVAVAIGAVLVASGAYMLFRSQKQNRDQARTNSSEVKEDGNSQVSAQSQSEPTGEEKAKAETDLIGEYVVLCRQMLVKSSNSGGQIPQAELAQFNDRRRVIVHTLNSLNGERSIQRLNDALASASGPPPPPPEPKELLNQKLVYKMMTDPNYKVKEKKMSALESHVMANVKRAFWDGKKQAIKKGDFEPLLAEMIALLRKIPESCCIQPENAERLKVKLGQLFDLNFIQSQIQNGVFGLKEVRGLVNQIYSILRSRQSPERDAASEEFHGKSIELLTMKTSGEDGLISEREVLANAMQPVIEGLHEMMDNIRLDLVNYMMAGLRAGMNANGGEAGIEKQRELFLRRLDNKEVALKYTKVWLARSIEIELTRGAISIEGLKNDEAATFEKLHRAAFCDICLMDTVKPGEAPTERGDGATSEKLRTLSPGRSHQSHQIENMIPETLEVEAEDVKKLWLQLREVVESATMMLKAKTFLGGNKIRLKPEEFKQMHEFIHEMNSDTEVKEEISPYGEDGKYSLLTVSDPNSEKGRKRRLESAAALVASAYERGTGEKISSEKRKVLLNLFFQLVADGGNKDATYPVIHKVLRRTLRELVVDMPSTSSIMDSSAGVQKSLAKKFIGEVTDSVIQIALQIKNLTDHNLKVHVAVYNQTIKYVFKRMQAGMVEKHK